MSFWKSRKRVSGRASSSADTGRVQKAKRSVKRSPPVAMEVKILAVEALDSGLSAQEVGELVGVGTGTIHKWRKDYTEGGVQAMCRKASSISVRKQCSVLEEKIVAQRRANPDRGVRRIRDDLRRHEGIEVSAETVRSVVNDAGLGNPPPQPHRRPPGVRRFERSCPNALWQIDIFTFQLKRMYPVYLVGILDDHSRYVVGWGLFRQQNADAVLEVLKGAIGQWGAPREILSDNGRQFVAWRGQTRFQKVLRQQGVQHVRSAAHHPMTLGKVERFWQTVWREFLEEAAFASFADACSRLEHWIHYYNHQRPHQALDGACPADRFYGIADDVEEAVKQGCQENSLRLALGQAPQPPLYLLGQRGGADVRVVRRGEEIEVKGGDAVHGVMRMGAPFAIGEDGSFGRASQDDVEVEDVERRGALPGGGDGPQGRSAAERAVSDVRGQSADAVPGDGGGGSGFGPGAGAEAPRPQAEAGKRGARDGVGGWQRGAAQAAGALEDEVPCGEDAPGPGAQAGPGRAATWRGGEKKETAEEGHDSAGRCSARLTEEGGPEW
jgi:transposase InsO family protein